MKFVEIMNADDSISDLDTVAVVLRDLGFYWEANCCEKAADSFKSMVDQMRLNAANDN